DASTLRRRLCSLRTYSVPSSASRSICFLFLNDTATTEIYTLSLHDALPISAILPPPRTRSTRPTGSPSRRDSGSSRSEEHTSELQSHLNLVCRLLLEKKKTQYCLHICGPAFACADPRLFRVLFFFNDTATTEIYTLSLHDALPIFSGSS